MTTKKSYDIAVIGSGPGGYVAAIKSAQLGKKVALIEKGAIGGTCLNVGCIPTKTLLANSSALKTIKNAEKFGIKVGEISFDYAKMKERKDAVVDNLRKSLEGLIKSNGIDIIKGKASFVSKNELKVLGEENVQLSANKVIIASGSDPIDVKSFPCDHKRILNSSSILEIAELPKSLAIIGGGYIGCEFASLFAEMGVKVTVLEALDRILPLLPVNVSQALASAYDKMGIEMTMNVFVEGIENKGDGVTVKLAGGKTVDADLALVSIGRKMLSSNMGIEKVGVKTTERGQIEVNDKMETNVDSIYAIGDVTGKWMLAHVASHQGIVAASNACGIDAEIHYHAVPAVVFTTPEIALVGLSLEEAIKDGHDATVGTFPFQALGKSLAAADTEGFVQIVSDKKTKQILGAQVVGHDASSLISEITLAIHNELTLDCIIDTIHAHPTVAEAWLEAALIANETPLHFPPKKKAKA